ncbi:hypothetical protein SELMODRAFT_426889 [Selaginella moellendorffii]|uniref:Uncharacterized protein n=1 Tax=Selaginella moellendorffii TaxID=88036 RepID=D8SXU4_SELML|nr:hypothetical protein SELMODRAFT_426889 [Selaginella moellendorffii]
MQNASTKKQCGVEPELKSFSRRWPTTICAAWAAWEQRISRDSRWRVLRLCHGVVARWDIKGYGEAELRKNFPLSARSHERFFSALRSDTWFLKKCMVADYSLVEDSTLDDRLREVASICSLYRHGEMTPRLSVLYLRKRQQCPSTVREFLGRYHTQAGTLVLTNMTGLRELSTLRGRVLEPRELWIDRYSEIDPDSTTPSCSRLISRLLRTWRPEKMRDKFQIEIPVGRV